MVGSVRMVTSSRRAGRITNKTKLLIYRGSDKVDLAHAEVILWNDGNDGESAPKHQHVGAKGVESGEMLEHHLQAALSSHSLLHSQATNASSAPSSPTPSGRQANKADARAGASGAPAAGSSTGTGSALNYHIPTPDATGLVQNADYAKLYQAPSQRYHEPTNFIRFSDTVEEASGGWGGLGYCMDDEDERWLLDFNGKQQGGSGGAGAGSSSTGAASPVIQKEGKENMPLSAGRERRGKGKDKEKDKDVAAPPPPLNISEEVFEFVMGALEKHAEDTVPTLHTNLALIPTFASFEPLFSSPIAPSFLPSNELPRKLPETTTLVRMSRSIYCHWKDRRERRKGRSIMPQLNYDETNDGDPYVCFRRRDIRATRKTRRTDNFSVEQMQKLQYELRAAHDIAKMVVSREAEKKKLYEVEKEVWEAKWKWYETKKRWPSLGMTREEEDIITGRINTGTNPATSGSMAPPGMASGSVSLAAVNGQAALQASHPNIPRISKKMAEREREAEREKRERLAEASARTGERQAGSVAARWFAPDELKARMAVLRQRLEEELTRRKDADADWDDATDSSYQPLPQPAAEHAFRPFTVLDHSWAREHDEDDSSPTRVPSFRLRRGRGGVVRLDRRYPPAQTRRGPQPTAQTDFSAWLFPDSCSRHPSRRRPRSIDDVDNDAGSSDDATGLMKRRRLNETWRYDADNGGALGVGMGLTEDQNTVIIDDMASKYIRHRITLLRDADIEKLQPDTSVLKQAMASLDTPRELPPMPVFNRPQPPPQQYVTAQLQQQQAALQQQQQQQMEQFQRYQLQTQLQAQIAMQQQQAQAQAQVQAQAQAMAQAQAQAQAQQQQQQQQGQQGQVPMSNSAPTPDQAPAHARITSNGSTNGTPVQNNQMLPPQQNGRPNNKRAASSANANGVPGSNGSMPPPSQTLPRASVSPHVSMQVPLPNGTPTGNNSGPSPQMMNGNLMPNGKPLPVNMIPPNLQLQGQQIDPALQQRYIAAQARVQHMAQQQHAMQMANGAGAGGGVGGAPGLDMSDPNIAALSAMIANTANMPAAQQQQLQLAMQMQQNANSAGMGFVPNGNMQQGQGQGQGPQGQIDIHQQAAAAGYNNVQAFVDARTKAKLYRMAQTQQQQREQAAALQQAAAAGSQQQQNGPTPQPSISNASSNSAASASANGTSNGAQGVMSSPALPTGHLQLKFPPHAKAKLAGAGGAQAAQQSPKQQHQAVVQRAQ